MALGATLYDFDVELCHVERNLQKRLALRAARHPSETLDRLWLRVLAYCWLYEERIAFGPGLSLPDSPDLYAQSLTGEKTLWARVGKPDPERLGREADRVAQAKVAVLFESPERLQAFLKGARERGLTRLERAELASVEPSFLSELAKIDERRTRLALTIVGDHFYVERAGRVIDGPLVRGCLTP